MNKLPVLKNTKSKWITAQKAVEISSIFSLNKLVD
jgi:hypothetical protein